MVLDVHRLVDVERLAVAVGAHLVVVTVDRRDLLDIELAERLELRVVEHARALGPGDELGAVLVERRRLGHVIAQLGRAVARVEAVLDRRRDPVARRLVDALDAQAEAGQDHVVQWMCPPVASGRKSIHSSSMSTSLRPAVFLGAGLVGFFGAGGL
jgi:hypothetical protein